ncbi:MAG: DUF4258 domain-containing protein [Ignavibacteriae bacterium]|nr:DUF4258 domain-containing protein [Ignavibacteriota bacterium]
MKLDFTDHALNVQRERAISDTWIYTAIENPDERFVEDDGTIHYIKQINDFGGRFLRVVVNPISGKIVTVFFDRRIRKLK